MSYIGFFFSMKETLLNHKVLGSLTCRDTQPSYKEQEGKTMKNKVQYATLNLILNITLQTTYSHPQLQRNGLTWLLSLSSHHELRLFKFTKLHCPHKKKKAHLKHLQCVEVYMFSTHRPTSSTLPATWRSFKQ